ncbi:hypothetical protein HDU86_006171 [Geranomyces michiganensis]|nr:hypothetical protein HDU86_006171 [Geranomyces michiganensis]
MSKRTLDEASAPAGPAEKKSRVDTDARNGHVEGDLPTTARPTITKAEADLYDRQIRLWGMEAQQRMRHARILVIGVSGLSNEICKNLVLSGVGGITVISSGTVEPVDLGAQFFLRETDIGKNRAEAVVPRIQALNPRVEVQALPVDVHAQPDAFFADFDVVCCCNLDLDAMLRINGICRKSGKKFYAADTAGMIGYIFCDLNTHRYMETKKSSEKEDAVTTTVEKSLTYPRLEGVLSGRWGMAELESLSKRQLRDFKSRSDPVYFAFNVLWLFKKETGALPRAVEKDFEKLCSLRDTFMRSVECDPAYVTDALLRQLSETSTAELSAVCAILGGFAAQDILKVLSAKDAPLDNFFAFDGNEFSGKQMKLPPIPTGKPDQAVMSSGETVDLD